MVVISNFFCIFSINKIFDKKKINFELCIFMVFKMVYYVISFSLKYVFVYFGAITLKIQRLISKV